MHRSDKKIVLVVIVIITTIICGVIYWWNNTEDVRYTSIIVDKDIEITTSPDYDMDGNYIGTDTDYYYYFHMKNGHVISVYYWTFEKYAIGDTYSYTRREWK